jgi:hypothetical protein
MKILVKISNIKLQKIQPVGASCSMWNTATTKLIQENSFNPAPTGPERYWIIKQYQY